MKFNNYNYGFQEHISHFYKVMHLRKFDLYEDAVHYDNLETYLTTINYIEKSINRFIKEGLEYKEDISRYDEEDYKGYYEEEMEKAKALKYVLSFIKQEIKDKNEKFILNNVGGEDLTKEFSKYAFTKLNKKYGREIKIFNLSDYKTMQFYLDNSTLKDKTKIIPELKKDIDYTLHHFECDFSREHNLSDVIKFKNYINDMQNNYQIILNKKNSTNEEFLKAFNNLYKLSENQEDKLDTNLNIKCEKALNQKIIEECASRGLTKTYTIKTDGYINNTVSEGHGRDFSYWTEPFGIELNIFTKNNFVYIKDKVYSLKEINELIKSGEVYVESRGVYEISDDKYKEYYERYNTEDTNIMNTTVEENIFAKNDYLKELENEIKVKQLKENISFEEIEKDYVIFEEKRKESLLKVKDLLIDTAIKNDFKHLRNQEKLVSNIKEIEEDL